MIHCNNIIHKHEIILHESNIECKVLEIQSYKKLEKNYNSRYQSFPVQHPHPKVFKRVMRNAYVLPSLILPHKREKKLHLTKKEIEYYWILFLLLPVMDFCAKHQIGKILLLVFNIILHETVIYSVFIYIQHFKFV
jgi:hypothetical protein